jgi:hypothetical protein
MCAHSVSLSFAGLVGVPEPLLPCLVCSRPSQVASDDAFGDALNAVLLASKKVETTASEQTANQDNVSLARFGPLTSLLVETGCSLRPSSLRALAELTVVGRCSANPR